MDCKVTFGDMVMIKLDPENKSVRLKNGFELYVDLSYEPEKHQTVSGEVFGLPSKLNYTGIQNVGVPWRTPMELKYGDKVIVYYLSVCNALKADTRRYVLEGDDRYIFIPYQFIYCKYGEGWITPINGYCLIEPAQNPTVEAEKKRLQSMGMELVTFNKESKTYVSYGKVKYVGVPNKEYVDPNYTDNGVDVVPGEVVMLRKINDIPLQYDLHARIDGGAKYWRVQRRNILARL